MALTPRLELRQAQSLVMTPQLQQAIRLLQMSHVELAGYIEAELESNPFLERQDASETTAAAEMETGTLKPTTVERARDAIDAEPTDIDPEASPADGQRGGSADWTTSSRGASSDDGFSALDMAQAQMSLADHLDGQICLLGLSTDEVFIARHMIGYLDEAGYFTADCREIAASMAVTPDMVEGILKRLQGLEPSGVFARNLKECLAVQLAERNRLDPAMSALLDNLELLARRDFARLERICGVGLDDISDMLEELRALNPKPGLLYGEPAPEPPEPDILVTQDAQGGWVIELNPNNLPRLLVNESYFATVSRNVRVREEKDFLNERFADANWLIRTLDQRARTILAVAKEIVKQQDGFFTHGVRHLRPLNLKAVADAINMHESTVSRVTTNKSLACTRGVFELKYFFTAAIQSSAGGEAHSAEAVRDHIREMIEAEAADAVLSDEAIVAALQKNGIDIARRTVAKYREALNIPSSAVRRREKRLKGAQMRKT